MSTKTERFMSEYKTALAVFRVILDEKGDELDVESAHQLWAEHSDDYCAGWLSFRDEDITSEVLQAYTKWRGRHKPATSNPA